MLIIENMTALAAFIICLLAFMSGYALRRHVDAARDEWAGFSTYRPGKAVHHGRR